MPIVWRDLISVGNDAIDNDHKHLICLINSIELALRHEDTIEYLPVFIRQLVEYTKEHFDREEIIQKKAFFPLLEEHKREHHSIIGKLLPLEKIVVEYIEKKASGQLGVEEYTELNKKIIELARSWIIEHLLKEDKRMEYYLRKLPRNFT